MLTLSNCNNNPVSGNVDTPGRRDYTWTVDTLDSFNPLYRLWGSSTSDVWAFTSDLIYHYNGSRWETKNYRNLGPFSIWGTSSNNIYMGDQNGGIWHYDGTDFKETASLTKDGHSDIVFDNMWGDSPDDIYATGAYMDENGLANNSVIAHYSDNKWTMLNTDGIKGIVERLFKNKSDNKIYLMTTLIGGGAFHDSTCIYEYAQEIYKEIYSSLESKGLQADLSLINGEVYFILGNKIAKRINNTFQTFLEIDNPNFYQRIWGRNSEDIFLFMTDGLAHYNGTDIKYLIHFTMPRNHIGLAQLFDTSVFLLVDESPTNLSLIYNGVIK